MWAAPTASGHVEPSTVKKQHARTFKTIADQAEKNNAEASSPIRAVYVASYVSDSVRGIGVAMFGR